MAVSTYGGIKMNTKCERNTRPIGQNNGGVILNLITDPWIPGLRQSGKVESIAPWQVTEVDDPIVQLTSPRHDFNGALIQFLIGLLQTTVAPKNDKQWAQWLDKPPSSESLKSAFSRYQAAFEMAGEGPCFMQDFEPIDGDKKPISGLMIEAPGGSTSKQFKDHFVKEGTYNALCTCCAATALFALQTNAPAGGVGHRTSLRGGGPLTTLVIPDTSVEQGLPDTVWSTLWLNVLPQGNFESDAALSESKNIFPWLSKTRTSEAKTGKTTTPIDVNPLQMFWAMPRRIRLDWQQAENGSCDLCHAEDSALITHYVTKNYGVNYDGAWRHVLSPHYLEKKSQSYLPMHAPPGGMAYRYWLALTQGDDAYQAAKVVRAYQGHEGRQLKNEQLRLWIFGYDMDNMKARCWYEKQYPLVLIEDEEKRIKFCNRMGEMVSLATQVAGFVQSCVKDAWFSRPADARGDTSFLKEAFFEQSEAGFLQQMQALKNAETGDVQRTVVQIWHGQLTQHALKLFEHWVAQGDISVENPRRIAEAHRKLRNLLYGKKLLDNLGIKQKKEQAA